MQLLGSLGMDNSKAPAEGDRTRLKGNRILLVEDNEINKQITVGLLEDAGAQVEVAENGAIAIKKLFEHDVDDYYDIVMMDIQMPEMDGHEATRRIRGNPRFNALPIIAMTAHAMAPERKRSLDAGMNAHITKPIDPEILLQTIERHIPRGDADEFLYGEWKVIDQSAAARQNHSSTSEMSTQPATTQSITQSESETGCPPELPVLPGVDVKAALKRLRGNREKYSELLLGFRRKNARIAETLTTMLDHDDLSGATRLAHALKGSGGNLGMLSVYECAMRIESACRNGELALARKSVSALDAAMSALMASLPTIEKTRTASPAPGDPGTIDSKKITALLMRFENALETDLGEAQALIAALSAHIAGTAVGTHYAELAAAFNNFEFDAVRVKLRHMLDELHTTAIRS
jgi:two-component system, sensor histidine kinase and response regulator